MRSEHAIGKKKPNEYEFLPVLEHHEQCTSLPIHHTKVYRPSNQGEMDTFSKMILTLKSAKDVSLEDIKRGATKEYFYGTGVKQGDSYKQVLNHLTEKYREALKGLNLKGSIYGIASQTPFLNSVTAQTSTTYFSKLR